MRDGSHGETSVSLHSSDQAQPNACFKHSPPLPAPPLPTPPLPCTQVEYSKQLNESRIRVLAAREEAVQGLLGEAYAALAALSKDASAYKRLLTDLLVQVRLGRWGGVG